MNGEVFCFDAVAPVRERGLKCRYLDYHDNSKIVAPVRERGLKFLKLLLIIRLRSVAPVRERGLKCHSFSRQPVLDGRSRKGAWIEILM